MMRFTLIELLIVIACIGILAGLLLAATHGINNSARNTSTLALIKTVYAGLESYRNEYGYYPAPVDTGLDAGRMRYVKANEPGYGILEPSFRRHFSFAQSQINADGYLVDAFKRPLVYMWWSNPWQRLNGYSAQTIITPGNGEGNFWYMATSSGASGGSEPTWPQAVGDTVDDGTVRWECIGRPIYKTTPSPTLIEMTHMVFVYSYGEDGEASVNLGDVWPHYPGKEGQQDWGPMEADGVTYDPANRNADNLYSRE